LSKLNLWWGWGLLFWQKIIASRLSESSPSSIQWSNLKACVKWSKRSFYQSFHPDTNFMMNFAHFNKAALIASIFPFYFLNNCWKISKAFYRHVWTHQGLLNWLILIIWIPEIQHCVFFHVLCLFLFLLLKTPNIWYL